MRSYGMTSMVLKKCKSLAIPTCVDCYYDDPTNTNMLVISNNDTKELIAKFYMSDSIWVLSETNYPEFFI